jgi:hypothetical protein
LLENTDDAPYKYEVYDILKFCFDNYKEENSYILKYLNGCSPPMEESHWMIKRGENGATHVYLPIRVTL